MDFEKRKKLQSLKVVISEAIMFLAVIITVAVLALIVSGYWLNSDFEVERQGMLQISSVPTGANVEIDGDSAWLQRTNTSKVLSSGEHSITLSKDGYDTWSKTINITEGLLYRIHYPRLFLKERTSEEILDTTGAIFATVSPDHNKVVLTNNTTNWTLLNLNRDTIEPKIINIAKYFSSVSLAEDASVGLFTGEIIKANWDYDGTHILFKVSQNDQIEWVLIDTKDVTQSINLTKEFGADFNQIEILDNSANNLIAVQNGNLHKINVSNKSISAIILNNVAYFNHFDNKIAFCAKDDEGYYIGLIKIGDDNIVKYETTEHPVKVVISKFYDEEYFTLLSGDRLSLYKKDNFELVDNFDLNFIPDSLEVGHNGEFILAYQGQKIATLDMESLKVTEWELDGEKFGWIDNDMVYSVSEGDLIVYDFDGLNRRIIASDVSSHFPALITENKWLYYFKNDTLIREWLIAH